MNGNHLAQVWDVNIVVGPVGCTPGVLIADNGSRRVRQVIVHYIIELALGNTSEEIE